MEDDDGDDYGDERTQLMYDEEAGMVGQKTQVQVVHSVEGGGHAILFAEVGQVVTYYSYPLLIPMSLVLFYILIVKEFLSAGSTPQLHSSPKLHTDQQ